jgi:hypothetical protein
VRGKKWRAGREKGREEKEREGGKLTLGSKSGDHRLQNLRHNEEERERWRREGCCAGKIE